MCQDGFWKHPSYLPSLCPVPMPWRKSKELVAIGPKAVPGHNPRTPVSLRHVGEQAAISQGRGTAKRYAPGSNRRGVACDRSKAYPFHWETLLDQRITEPDEYDWPESRREAVSPAGRLTVAIDGTYVRADRMMGLGEHHVVAGRVERDGFLGGSFAWVTQYPLCDDLAYMKAALETHGWTPESHVTVLADGADGLNNLVCATTEKASRKILDWFHISMGLRPIEQMARGMAVVAEGAQAVLLKELLETKLPNVRHQMWNGQWHAALDRMGDIYRASAHLQKCSPASDADRVRRFREHLVKVRDYLCPQLVGADQPRP